ncbi:MAG: response regulator, partial [Spirochaetales bacterium]|nr:response regulator [Spirochaetales bacterium]
MPPEKYKILLADDEVIIRDGISENIDWENEGFCFLSPAADGDEAIESIDKHSPDVVITDICMPGKTGIEIAEYIFEKSPDTLVLILSGYDDFEYARTALRYKVFDYILKPISAKTLKNILNKIRSELERRQSNKINYQRLIEEVEKNRECILSRFLYRVIKGNSSKKEIEEYKKYLPFSDTISSFCAITLVISVYDHPSSVGFTYDMCLIALAETASRLIPDYSEAVNFQSPTGNLIIILGDNNERLCRINAALMADKLHNETESFPGYRISIGVGTVQPGLLEVGTSYNESLAALEYRLLAGNNEVFIFREKENRVTFHDIEFGKSPDRIKDSLRSMPLNNSVEIINNFFISLKKSKLPIYRIKFELSKFVYSIIDVFDEIDVIDDIDELISIIELPDLTEIESALITVVTTSSERLKDQRKRFPEKKLHEIQKYLETEFSNPKITAEEITHIFYISQSYLSRLFKQYSGKTFSEYLTGLRISRACELLKTTNKKNFQIAEEVGFNDPGYFSVIFKKSVGVSPS